MMYFPYLRGRQYELLALKELIENDRMCDSIIPIIEPVKITPTLLNTLLLMNDKGKRYVIINNPSVGSFISDSKKEKNSDIFEKIKSNMVADNVYSGIIINEKSPELLDSLLSQGVPKEKIAALCLNSDEITNLQMTFRAITPQYSIIPYSPSFRRVRQGKRVMIDDKFNKLPRNNDYLSCEDEFFSDDHLFCYEDGYAGFSDYSVVGEEYSDSGFAPYAVAIHIVYPVADKSFRIHHFVSDSNSDISDPAKKFYEALTKLIEWNEEYNLNTLAIERFENMYLHQRYSGLGVIKKLSIMNHIELVSRYLKEVLV